MGVLYVGLVDWARTKTRFNKRATQQDVADDQAK